MCQKCEQIILDNLHINDVFKTARGKTFTITKIKDGKIHIETSRGGAKWFHLEHAGLCLHWMIVGKNSIDGVGSQDKNSVRGLVGSNGSLVQCNKCDWNPAYIWGILASMYNVKRSSGNILSS